MYGSYDLHCYGITKVLKSNIMEQKRYNLFFPLIIFALTSSGFADRVNIEDCGSEYGKVIDVRVSGCTETDKKCILKKNSNVTIEIDFLADKDSDKLKLDMYGILAGIPTPYPLDNPNACKDSGIECPIKKGNKYAFFTNFYIQKKIATGSVDIQVKLESDKDYVCIIFPAKIKK